jgi:hypothetical protein
MENPDWLQSLSPKYKKNRQLYEVRHFIHVLLQCNRIYRGELPNLVRSAGDSEFVQQNGFEYLCIHTAGMGRRE